MPYRWTTPPGPPEASLRLWPHQSLGPRGFAAFFAIFAVLAAVPFVAVIGSPALWVMLAFVAPVFGGVWFALRRNARDAATLYEEIRLRPDQMEVIHHPARGPDMIWRANPYWVRLDHHAEGGPVPHYLTLEGGPRSVEIGRFLSESERIALEGELRDALARMRQRPGVSPAAP